MIGTDTSPKKTTRISVFDHCGNSWATARVRRLHEFHIE